MLLQRVSDVRLEMSMAWGNAYHPASFDSAVERTRGVRTYGFGGGSA